MNKLSKPESGQSADDILKYWQEAVPKDRLAHLIKDVTRALVRELQARLSDYDIPFGYWTFLRILWEEDGLTQRELSARAGVMEPTTFRALNAMEERGYIVRKRASDNKKNVYLFLTRRGRFLKRKLVPLAEEVNEIAVAGIRVSDIETTRNTLLTMLRNLALDEAASNSKSKT